MKQVARTRKGIVSMSLHTIGYSGKTAKELFGILTENKVWKVLDIRLKNANGYCFYTHKRDFPFLLSLCGIAYEHKEKWAPKSGFSMGIKTRKSLGVSMLRNITS